MKLATYSPLSGGERVGIIHSDDRRIFDLRAASSGTASEQHFHTMLTLIDGGAEALEAAKGLLERKQDETTCNCSLDDVRLLSPLPQPRQLRDFMTFPSHIKQSSGALQRMRALARGDREAAERAKPLAEVPALYLSHPSNFLSNRFSVVGYDATVKWPPYSKLMDFELELAMVVGKKGVNIELGQARDHVFGYTIFNDFSARDTQMIEMPTMMGPGKAKSFDTGNVLGPWIVTADEIPDPTKLRMSAKVNGEVWSESTSEGMLFSFEDMIVHVSRDETIHGGEVYGSGTVGNGCGLELGRFLADGDIVELEIEKIGCLRNQVVRQD